MDNNSAYLQEIASLLTRIQQRISSLESKVDSLISRNAPQRQPGAGVPAPVQNPPRPVQNVQNQPRQEKRNRERPMFQAVCADCRKECEIPFKPTGDRPVYCRECFAIRKSGNAPKPAGDTKFPAGDTKFKDITPPNVITKIDWRNEEVKAPPRKDPVVRRKAPPAKQKPVKKAPARKKKKDAR